MSGLHIRPREPSGLTRGEAVGLVLAAILGAPALMLALPWLSWVLATYCVALGGCQ